MNKIKLAFIFLIFFATTNSFAIEWSTHITPGLIQTQIHNNYTYVQSVNGSALAVPGCPQANWALIVDQPGSKNVISTVQIAKAMGKQIRFGGTCDAVHPEIYFRVEYVQAQ